MEIFKVKGWAVRTGLLGGAVSTRAIISLKCNPKGLLCPKQTTMERCIANKAALFNKAYTGVSFDPAPTDHDKLFVWADARGHSIAVRLCFYFEHMKNTWVPYARMASACTFGRMAKGDFSMASRLQQNAAES